MSSKVLACFFFIFFPPPHYCTPPPSPPDHLPPCCRMPSPFYPSSLISLRSSGPPLHPSLPSSVHLSVLYLCPLPHTTPHRPLSHTFPYHLPPSFRTLPPFLLHPLIVMEAGRDGALLKVGRKGAGSNFQNISKSIIIYSIYHFFCFQMEIIMRIIYRICHAHNQLKLLIDR